MYSSTILRATDYKVALGCVMFAQWTEGASVLDR